MDPSPYAQIPGPEWFFFMAALLITVVAFVAVVAAWTFYSARKLFSWYASIVDSFGRWESILLPPPDVAREIWWFVVVAAINALLIAAGLFLTGWIVYVSG